MNSLSLKQILALIGEPITEDIDEGSPRARFRDWLQETVLDLKVIKCYLWESSELEDCQMSKVISYELIAHLGTLLGFSTRIVHNQLCVWWDSDDRDMSFYILRGTYDSDAPSIDDDEDLEEEDYDDDGDDFIVDEQDSELEQELLGSVRTDLGRLPKGIAVPREYFKLPILRVLYYLDGRAPKKQVMRHLERTVQDKLQEVDYEELPGTPKEIRWKKNAAWARYELVHEQGFLKSDSPHGIWELSDSGLEYLLQCDDE